MFQIECPNCGKRNVSEFRFGGEVLTHPAAPGGGSAWVDYLYLRTNSSGTQTEWWYHRMGCQRWFKALRHTSTNEVVNTFWPQNPSKPDNSTQGT